MKNLNQIEYGENKDDSDPKKSFIFLWAFDKSTGVPYVDSLVEITAEEQIKNILKLNEEKSPLQYNLHLLSLRQRFSNTQVALFHVPQDMTRDKLEQYIQNENREVLVSKLKKAKFSI